MSKFGSGQSPRNPFSLVSSGALSDNSGGAGHTGDGNPPGGDMEARIAKLEATTSYIERDISYLRADLKSVSDEISSIRTTDFRTIFGCIIAVALGLSGLMAKGFGWL